MTIGIGRKFGRRIIILSDTMISDSAAGKTNSIPGRLKAIVLSPHVSVAYAGHSDPALSAVRRARSRLLLTGEISAAAEVLIEASASSWADVEFILAFHKDGCPFLHKVTARGMTGDLDECFIGDADVVREVIANEPKQPTYKGHEAGLFADEVRFTGAFNALFSGVSVNDAVGGFPVNLLGSPYGHLYQGGAFSAAWDTVSAGIGITAAQHEVQRSGATAWEWVVVNAPLRGVALVGVALPQAGVGVIYSPLTDDEPALVRLPVPEGSGFIDSRPLQASIKARLQALLAIVGGGVVELDASWEQQSD